jgi:hypothetical protein
MPRLNSAGPDFNTAPVPAGGQHDLRISSTNDLRRSGREEQLAAAATSEEQRTATSLRLARRWSQSRAGRGRALAVKIAEHE